MTEATIDQTMRDILISSKTIAVIGASNKTHRASFSVMQFLQAKGFKCIPVSPRLAGQELLSEKVYADLASIPQPIDLVDMFINSEAAGTITDEAIAAGAKAIWMQLGVINEAAADRAREAGLQIVMDHCPAQEWSRLGLS
jgi:predicted CoA-binding protein